MEEMGWGQILVAMAVQFTPVWVALVSDIRHVHHLQTQAGALRQALRQPRRHGRLWLVMFWVFTAFFANWIITHDPLGQVSGMKNKVPGTACKPQRKASYAYYLLGGDHLARDVFSRMVMGARAVLKITPAATPSPL